ncbi:small ribosomal subunit protein uS12-like [Peromyscus eremicus]|uniref:small ribosomal subunit protein uS12-like n=1 Tax=Peromyscus eremicus TaxID=42410 RepID=UPI0027DC4691|nr:small ribosomal subunit protein uS12-like [Peromyscus eremicus]
MGNRRSLHTAMKLHSHQQSQKWHDTQHKEAHWGTAVETNPVGGASQAKGTVLEHVGIKLKHPNSANRKWVRVQFTKYGKKITVPVPKDSCLNFTEENNDVLVAGFGQKGHAIGNDTPGVLFKAVQVANVSLLAQHKGKETKIINFGDGDTVINSHILKNKNKTRGQRSHAPVVLQGGV